jgi:hypothetical protein
MYKTQNFTLACRNDTAMATRVRSWGTSGDPDDSSTMRYCAGSQWDAWSGEFGTHVVSKGRRSRSLSTICMSHPGKVWSWKDLQSLYTSMCSFHCGHFFNSVKCIDRSLLSVVHSNCVEICWSQLQQCVGLAEHTAAAVSSCGKHQHSEWGPCVWHMRPRSQHSGMPIARSRRSPDIHHPKGHQGALTYQSEKDSEERLQRVQ